MKTTTRLTALFDIWLAISNFLPVKDLLALQAVSKDMYHIINEHAVWFSSVKDILIVTALPHLRQFFRSMSGKDLKQRVIVAARLAHKSRHRRLRPENIYSYQCDFDVSSLSVLPGGEWIVVLLRDGTLRLHSTMPYDAPVAVETSQRIDSTVSLDSFQATMWVSTSSHDPLLLLRTVTIHPGWMSKLVLYRIDTANASFHPIKTVTRDFLIAWCSITNDLVLFGWMDPASHHVVVSVQNVPNTDQKEKSITIDLGDDVTYTNCRISVLSSRQFVIATSLGLSFYNIPELLEEHNYRDTTPIQAEIACLHSFASESYLHITQLGFHHITPPSCMSVNTSYYPSSPQPDRFSTLHAHLTLSRLPRCSKAVLSPGRAIVVHNDMYRTCAIWPWYDELGMNRLGEEVRNGSPFITQTALIELDSPKPSDVEDLSWDEESGRLCLLNVDPESHRKSMVIMEF